MPLATRWQDRLFLLLGLTKGKKVYSPADIYSETVYRDLIRSESMRSERSGYRCRILLVCRTDLQGGLVPVEQEIAIKMISLLSTNLRATDYIGWYRNAYILGAILTMLSPDSAVDGCNNLKIRVIDSLRGALAFTDDHSLRVAVLEQGQLTTLSTSNRLDSFLGSRN